MTVMSSQTEQLQLTVVQTPSEEVREENASSEQKKTYGSHQHKLPLKPLQFSSGSLPDDGEAAMEGSVPVLACIDIQKKASLQVRKFFYPKFKRRACGIVALGSVQCSVKEKEKIQNCLQLASTPEPPSSVTLTSKFLQQTDSGNKAHSLPQEVPLSDIVSCESPANFLKFGDRKEFPPKNCTATPIPVNRNSAFRVMDSPLSEKFPRLSFASLEVQRDKQLALTNCNVPSLDPGKVTSITKSYESKSVLCSNIANVLMDSDNSTEPLPKTGIQLDEQDKENNPPMQNSNSKAVLVYRSLQKTKKRGRLRPRLVTSSRHADDKGTGFLKTRSSTRLEIVMCSRQVGSGPVLRSGQSVKEGGKLIKERPLSAYGSKKSLVKALLEKYLRNQRLKCGTPSRREACLPFLNGEVSRRVECFYCKAFVAGHQLVICSHKDCSRSYHLTCGQSLENFHFRKNGDAVCPQHVCMVCGGYNKSKVFRCERCTVAAHRKCFAFPEFANFLESKPDCFICWRHPQDWRLESEYKVPTVDTREAFKRLPLPYSQVEFSIGSDLPREVSGNGHEPTPFIHIRRNLFLVKKKRDNFDDGVGCSCKDSCCDSCECRAQSMSCSKSCSCYERCGNRPFRREKKFKLVKTVACGWGVQSCEAIAKGEFIVEYVGEVINEAMCEERLWTLKERGDQNFYMCEIGKDFIIDATFKGNASRFVNHSCDPNCILEKWRVDGEMRVGIFAIRDIKDGEALTYDYRFVQFGPTVKCQCGSRTCRGNLGESYQQKRNKQVEIPLWGEKQRRSHKY